MRRDSLLIGVAALALVGAGCTTEDAPAADPPQSSASETRSTETDDGPETTPAAEDPLLTTAVNKVPGHIDSVVAARDGTVLVLMANEYADVSHYRIYDRRWRPTTRPLRVPVFLDEVQGRDRGFAAIASRTKPSGRYAYRSRVDILGDGSVRTASADQPPQPNWQTRDTQVNQQAGGGTCALENRTPAGGDVRTSLDGRAWRTLTTSGLPAGAGARLWTCAVAGDRVVVETGGSEYPAMLHTYDRSSGELLANLPVGDGTPVDPYAWWLLSDGTLVAETSGLGVVVATDDTNASVVPRGGPVGEFPLVVINGKQIAQVRGDRQVAISDDRGLTWRVVDLRLPFFS